MNSISISDLSSPQALASCFALGVLLHIGVLRHGSLDTWAPHIIIAPFIVDCAAAYTLRHFIFPDDVASYSAGAKLAAPLISAAIAGIYTSLLLYRGVFHRLCRFPGEPLARFTNLHVTSLTLKKMQLHHEIRRLHEKHGDFVRVGPQEISIADPRAVNIIHASQSPCAKGPWYSILHPEVSLQMVRSRKEHSTRRKAWDKGLNAKSLRDYEPRINKYITQLMGRIEENQGKPMNMTTWFNYYSFDVMGDLAFDRGFDMLKDGITHFILKTVHKNMLILGTFSHLVWLFPILSMIPGANSTRANFLKWVHAEVARRRSKKPDQPDLYSWILADYDAKGKLSTQETINMHADAHLIIIAGSDTTAVTLTCLFFELAQHPEVVAALQAEIDQYWAGGEQSHAALTKLEYLQACINETLRLHPPVPSGVQRFTPPEGIMVGETFVPGNTIVVTPTYTLHRDARSFPQPDEFIPERWTTRPELIKDASGFTPFSAGKYSCVGKQLALAEIRGVTSDIMHRYNFALAPGQSPDTFLSKLQDRFTLTATDLNLVFTARKDRS